MGNQSELALAMRELRQELKLGLINQFQFDSRASELRDEHMPRFAQERKVIPKANPWVPAKRAAVLAKGLGQDYAIDPETGRVIALNPQAQERMTVKPDLSGKPKAAGTKRFPSGSAIVLGFKRDGTLVDKLLTVGAGCSDPYIMAARIANRIVERGGIAIYGYRRAGYEIHDGQLVASPDRMVGRRQVVGMAGAGGLSLIDARTHQDVSQHDRIVWMAWLVTGNAKRAAKRLARFIAKPKASKADLKLAHDAAQAMVQGVPFHERQYVEHWAHGTAEQLNYDTHETNKILARVPIGCSALDCSLPVDPEGIPFLALWDSGDQRVSWADMDPSDPDACEAHARVLALRTAGPQCVQHIRWTDATGERLLTRGDALRALSESGDPYLDDLRASFDPDGDDPEEYVASLIEHLDPLSRGFQDHREDKWMRAHEAAERAAQALEDTSKDDDEEAYQKAQLALLEAQTKRVRATRELIPAHQGKVTMRQSSGSTQSLKMGQKAKNSKKGATWDRMKRAQAFAASSRI